MITEYIKKSAEEYAKSIPQSEERQKYCEEDFIANAEWMEEEFKKNRLLACDNQTKEEAERESDFCEDFIKKNFRIPTISDAIEITRKTMIDKACEFISKHQCEYIDIDEFRNYLIE